MIKILKMDVVWRMSNNSIRGSLLQVGCMHLLHLFLQIKLGRTLFFPILIWIPHYTFMTTSNEEREKRAYKNIALRRRFAWNLGTWY